VCLKKAGCTIHVCRATHVRSYKETFDGDVLNVETRLCGRRCWCVQMYRVLQLQGDTIAGVKQCFEGVSYTQLDLGFCVVLYMMKTETYRKKHTPGWFQQLPQPHAACGALTLVVSMGSSRLWP
jgi:hypothetical protein